MRHPNAVVPTLAWSVYATYAVSCSSMAICANLGTLLWPIAAVIGVAQLDRTSQSEGVVASHQV